MHGFNPKSTSNGDTMGRKANAREDEFGFKTSSGVNYDQVLDRHIEDERFQRVRAGREGAKAPAPAPTGPKAGAPSATMDAVMRMLTGKEERTIADRISDPNRPTWEEYKKENADKLDLNDKGEKEMREYRKQLDAAREKAFGKRSSASSSKKSKKKKRSRSVSSSDGDSDSGSEDDSRRRSSSRRSSRKTKKNRKRRRASSSDSDSSDESDSSSESERDDDRRRSRKHSKKTSKKSKKKSHKKKRSKEPTGEHSPSPVRLSSFLNGSDSE